MSAVDVLVRAEELLYEEDWSPTAARGPDGPRCPYWAIVDAVGLDKSSEYEACEAFAAAVGVDALDIPVWNGASGRTRSDVMDAFGRAIVLAKERAS